MVALAGRFAQRKQWVPPATARVNWDHPLAQGLHDLILPYGSGINIARPHAQPTATGTIDRSATKWGRAMSWTAGSYITIPSRGQDISWYDGGLQPWAIKMLFRPTAWAATNSALISKGTAGADCDLTFMVDGGGANGDLTSGNVAKGETGSNMNTNWTQDSDWDIMIATPSTLSDNYIPYTNGQVASTTANPGGTNGDPTDANMDIGHGNLSDRTINDTGMDVSYIGVWRRYVDLDEVAWLYEDPWAMVTTREPRHYTILNSVSSSGGIVKVRSGGAWVPGTVKVRSGGAWVTGDVKVRSGGAWVQSQG